MCVCVYVFTHISTYMLKSYLLNIYLYYWLIYSVIMDLRFKCEMLYIQTLFDLQGMLPPAVKLVISLLN